MDNNTIDNVNKKSLRDHMKIEFERRTDVNSSYSLRAFALNLGINRSSLSDYLTGKKQLSKQSMEKVIGKLKLEPENIDLNAPLVNRKPYNPSEKDGSVHWSYFAILNILDVTSGYTDTDSIAEALKLDSKLVGNTLNVLLSQGFIEKQNGNFVRCVDPLGSSEGYSDENIKSFHKGILNKAIDQIEAVDVNRREYAAITFSGDPEKMALAKKELSRAMDKIQVLLEGPEKTQVYCLSAQLFPLITEE